MRCMHELSLAFAHQGLTQGCAMARAQEILGKGGCMMWVLMHIFFPVCVNIMVRKKLVCLTNCMSI